MNKVILIGNLTRDPELATTSTGAQVCKFSIAVARKYKNQAGEIETDFFNCVAWRNLAENLAKFTKKGSKVSIVGSVQNRSYEAQDGTKRYVTEIMVDEVEFISSPKAAEDGSQQAKPTQPTQPRTQQAVLTPIDDTEGLPF